MGERRILREANIGGTRKFCCECNYDVAVSDEQLKKYGSMNIQCPHCGKEWTIDPYSNRAIPD